MARRPAHHSRRLAIFALVTAFLFVARKILRRLVRSHQVRVAQAEPFPYLDTVSQREGCDIEGLRFLAGALTPAQIKSVTGRPALSPIRVYAGLAHGSAHPDPALLSSPELPTAERVRYAMDELERLGAFERSLIMVVAPTGRGYAHPIPVESVELATGGDVATATIQYADDRTMRAVHKLDDAALLHRQLIAALQAHIAQLPEGARRPRLCVYGESLGAWASQEGLIHGSDGLLSGLDAGVWVGTPHASRVAYELAQRLEGLGRHVQEVSRPEQIRPDTSFVLLGNEDDPIVYYNGIKVMLLPQPWVKRLGRRWIPGLTLAKALLEVEAATRPVPGVRTANGHDYRAIIDQVLVLAYDLGTPNATRREDLLRKMASFLDEHERTRRARMAFLHSATPEKE